MKAKKAMKTKKAMKAENSRSGTRRADAPSGYQLLLKENKKLKGKVKRLEKLWAEEKKMRAADAYAFGESIRELAGGVWPVSFRYLGLGTSAHVLCQCYLDTLA